MRSRPWPHHVEDGCAPGGLLDGPRDALNRHGKVHVPWLQVTGNDQEADGGGRADVQPLSQHQDPMTAEAVSQSTAEGRQDRLGKIVEYKDQPELKRGVGFLVDEESENQQFKAPAQLDHQLDVPESPEVAVLHHLKGGDSGTRFRRQRQAASRSFLGDATESPYLRPFRHCRQKVVAAKRQAKVVLGPENGVQLPTLKAE